MEFKDFIERLAEAVEIESVENLMPETEFRELDDWSSLSVMLLIAFFDEEFDKEISSSAIKECITIQDLYNLAIA